MTLIGNVEGNVLQRSSPEDVERVVQHAVCAGGRKHFILVACDVAVSAIDEHLRDNILTFFDAGTRYGTFGA